MWLTRLVTASLAISLAHAAAVSRYDLRRRDSYMVQENVLITEQLNVLQQPDGTKVIGQSEPVATTISDSAPVRVIDNENQSLPLSSKPTSSFTDLSSKSEPNSEHVDTSADQSKAPVLTKPQPNEVPPVELMAEPENTPAEASATSPGPKSPLPQFSENTSLGGTPLKTIEEQNHTSDDLSSPSKEDLRTSSKVVASSKAKRGIAYNDIAKLSAFTSSSKVSWAYNWGSSTPSIPNTVEFVPMLWGTGAHAAGWNENADRAIASGSTHLLAFNEPDQGDQASMSVGDAVAGYKNLMQPYAGKAKLGSPAVTNGGSPMGLTYLKSFIAACTGCTIDFVAIHWYNGGSADDFKNYVLKAHVAGGGRPIWITEFEGPGDAQQQQKFLKEVLPWLDNQDYVERYAYFMASDGNLISSGSIPSAVGQAYAFDD